jgi:hypothetical protein
LHRQRAHVSLLADPPGSQVRHFKLYGIAIKTPVGGEKCSSCGTLSEGAGVESEDEEKAGIGVDDGVEDGIEIGVGVNLGGGEIFLLLD